MTRDEFNKQFKHGNRCIATYRCAGYVLRGLLLDDVWESITGAEYVCVNSFSNRVPLADIDSVRDTGKPWEQAS